MKLILLRHAKSSWDDFTLDDHDRPLNDRGRASAQLIGGWLKTNGHLPDIAVSSTAARAKETLDLSIAAANTTPQITLEAGLYHASPDRVLRQIHKSPSGTLLLVGHNPGFGEIASMLVTHAPHHKDFARYPTASTLVAEFDVTHWRDVKFGSGTVIDFVTPRDLAE